MRPELRDEFLRAADEAVQQVGCGSFENAIDFVCRFAEGLLNLAQPMRTREGLEKAFDGMADLDADMEQVAIALTRRLPQFLAVVVTEHGAKAVQEFLPERKRGRRAAIAEQDQAALCDYIGELHVRKGVSEAVAKRRAAQKFGVSLRTVHRIWNDRAAIMGRVPEPDDLLVRNQRNGQPLRRQRRRVQPNRRAEYGDYLRL